MSDPELLALTALTQRETAQFEAGFRQYGEMQFSPQTPYSVALHQELVSRGVIK